MNEQITLGINDAVRITGLGRTTIYAAIKSGDLKLRKAGRRSLILTEDLKAWASNLPEASTRRAA